MGKKIINKETEIQFFKSILERIKIEKFFNENNIIFMKPEKSNFLLILEIDSELKKHIELNFTEIDNSNLLTRINFLTKAMTIDNWTQIDQKAEIYLSNIFPIEVKNFAYKLIINRDQMPFKLLKSEYDSIYFTVNNNILLIKKRFDSKIENYGFSIIRGFQCL